MDEFTRGWLATWRADQHATLDNLTQAQADVEAADMALDAGDDHSTGGSSLAATTGTAYVGTWTASAVWLTP